MIRTARHAVFANTVACDGTEHTFRVGRPVDWNRAIARWDRLDQRRLGRKESVKFEGRRYQVKSMEVRAVDRNGLGLGSERHAHAMHVPYRSMKAAGR